MGPEGLEHVIVGDYGEYVTEPTDIPLPDFIRSAALNRSAMGSGPGKKR